MESLIDWNVPMGEKSPPVKLDAKSSNKIGALIEGKKPMGKIM